MNVQSLHSREHPNITTMTPEEAEEFRKANKITVSGRDCPKPIRYFSEGAFPDYLTQTLAALKFTDPTPIQAQGWPVALKGRDVVGIADTGSGKTLAYLLPGNLILQLAYQYFVKLLFI